MRRAALVEERDGRVGDRRPLFGLHDAVDGRTVVVFQNAQAVVGVRQLEVLQPPTGERWQAGVGADFAADAGDAVGRLAADIRPGPADEGAVEHAVQEARFVVQRLRSDGESGVVPQQLVRLLVGHGLAVGEPQAHRDEVVQLVVRQRHWRVEDAGVFGRVGHQPRIGAEVANRVAGRLLDIVDCVRQLSEGGGRQDGAPGANRRVALVDVLTLRHLFAGVGDNLLERRNVVLGVVGEHDFANRGREAFALAVHFGLGEAVEQ